MGVFGLRNFWVFCYSALVNGSCSYIMGLQSFLAVGLRMASGMRLFRASRGAGFFCQSAGVRGFGVQGLGF